MVRNATLLIACVGLGLLLGWGIANAPIIGTAEAGYSRNVYFSCMREMGGGPRGTPTQAHAFCMKTVFGKQTACRE